MEMLTNWCDGICSPIKGGANNDKWESLVILCSICQFFLRLLNNNKVKLSISLATPPEENVSQVTPEMYLLEWQQTCRKWWDNSIVVNGVTREM